MGFPVVSSSVFTCRWLRDDVPVAGADRPVLAMLRTPRSAKGIYRLEVSNASGARRSAEVRLEVDAMPARPGFVDPTFGAAVGFKDVDGLPFMVEIKRAFGAGGGYYVAADFTRFGDHTTAWVARLESDGSTDRGFVFLADEMPPRIVIDASLLGVSREGMPLMRLASLSGPESTVVVSELVRLRPDGRRDTSFALSTHQPSTIGPAVELPDGKWLYGGTLLPAEPGGSRRLSRMNRDGTLDDSYRAFVSTNQTVSALARQSDGRVVALVSTQETIFTRTVGLRRFLADGGPDPSFQTGVAFPSTTAVLERDRQDRLLVARQAGDRTISPPRLIRLLPDGALDPTFQAALPEGAGVASLDFMPDGRILALIGGLLRRGAPLTDLIWLRDDGSLDGEFSFDPVPSWYPAFRMVEFTADDGILLAGSPVNDVPGHPGVIRVRAYDDARIYEPRFREGRFEALLRPTEGRRYRIETAREPAGADWFELRILPGTRAPLRWSEPLRDRGFFRLRVEE